MRTEPQLRKQQVKALKQYYKQSRQRFEKWAAVGYKKPPPAPIPFPEICAQETLAEMMAQSMAAVDANSMEELAPALRQSRERKELR